MLQDVEDFEKDIQLNFTVFIVMVFLFNLGAFILSGVNYHFYLNDLQNILNLMTGVPWEQAQVEKEFILNTIKNIEEEPSFLLEYMELNWSSDFYNDIIEKRRTISDQIK